MKTAYFNCSSGVSGDMVIASLMDALNIKCAPFERRLKRLLKFRSFGLNYTVSHRYHAPAMHLDVTGNTLFESPRHIQRLISCSKLPDNVKARAQKALALLVSAEARVHCVKNTHVHFHELNSVDTLIDITAPLLLLHENAIDSVIASEINIGNPAPATLEIVRKCSIPVYSSLATHELTTPTGAALISTITDKFGGMPVMRLTGSGIACGAMDIPNHRNILKVFVGDSKTDPSGYGSDEVVSLETNIDDMDPRVYPYVTEKMLSAGALDVWLENVTMKKGRPGIVVHALARPDIEQSIVDILFNETTTLGIRRSLVARHVLKRKIGSATKTSFNNKNGKRTRIEYEAAKNLAMRANLRLRDVLD